MILPLLYAIFSLSTAKPCIDTLAAQPACQDSVVLDSLVGEIGNGASLSHRLAVSIRRAALHLAAHSKCARVRYEAEELAFDLGDWLDHEHDVVLVDD